MYSDEETRSAKKSIFAVLAIFVIGLVIWSANHIPNSAALSATPAATQPTPSLTPTTSGGVNCTEGIQGKLAIAQDAMKKKDPFTAFDTLYPCREQLTDPAAKELYKNALVASNKQKAAEFEIERKKDLLEKKFILAQKKREGVRVGMTEQDVLDSSWGRPTKVNTTTRANSTSAQWVYRDGGGYLYFENGILTTIQN